VSDVTVRTHKKEQALWKSAGIAPGGHWYLSAGSGMAEALRMAAERRAYTLTDRGTYLALSRTLPLQVVFEGGPALRNSYAVICVNPQRHPGVNIAGARQFAAFLLLPETRKFVGAFGKVGFGQPLFHVYPTNTPQARCYAAGGA
jgi:tungstate transport system substrate-binding protein